MNLELNEFLKTLTVREWDELIELHNRYRLVTSKTYSDPYIFTFPETVDNILSYFRGLQDDDKEVLRENVITSIKSVLEAMVYTGENTVEEMVERAEAEIA